MTNHVRKLLTLSLQHDLTTFIQRTFQTVSPGHSYLHNWHIEVIAHHLELCLEGKITRLIINVPPRHLKSICASVAFPAWTLGHDPTSRIVCVSYSNDLASKLARDCRAVIESGWYRKVFPRTRLDPRKNTEFEVTTTKRGCRLATSVAGTLTGRGGTLIIIDDPLKASDAMSESNRESVNQWFANTLYSRLDNKAEDCIVLITQRLHTDDLVGHLLAKNKGWTHLNLPAIAETDECFDLGDGSVCGRKAGEALHPDHESLETLVENEKTMGVYDFSAQYQQRPVPIGGGMIKWEWFKFYAASPERKEGDFVTQSWDTASKAEEINDWSVCTTWLREGNNHYLIDVRRVRREYPGLKKLIGEMAVRDRPDAVLIEDKGSGTQLIQDLQHEGEVRPIGIKTQDNKIIRMQAQTAKIEAGYVSLPETAPWLDDFRTEVLQFPRGRHDDQVDSMSQYLGWEGSEVPMDALFMAIPSRVVQEWGLPPRPWESF